MTPSARAEGHVKTILLPILLLLEASSALAETRYVTDQFQITLRLGESATHKIQRMLPSGTAVEVLRDDAKTGYSRVRLADGKKGFVLTRQLMEEPSARDRLAQAEARLRELQEEPGKLSSRLARLQQAHEKLSGDHKQLQTAEAELERNLATIRRTANNAVRISNERNELRKSVATLTRELEDLKQENRDLHNHTAQNWFLIGAGVVVGGILLGLILPRLRFQRRKSSWGSL